MMDSNIRNSGRDRSAITEQIKEKRVQKQAQIKLLVSFVLMMAFTLSSFYAVLSESIPNSFAVPFILVLAILQVFLQVVLFMHLDERGSGYQTLLICGGLFFAVVIVATLVLLIWW